MTRKSIQVIKLSKVENIEEIYEVKGEFDIISIVSASSLEESFVIFCKRKNMKIKSVKSTITSIVLKAHKQPKSTLSNIRKGLTKIFQFFTSQEEASYKK